MPAFDLTPKARRNWATALLRTQPPAPPVSSPAAPPQVSAIAPPPRPWGRSTETRPDLRLAMRQAEAARAAENLTKIRPIEPIYAGSDPFEVFRAQFTAAEESFRETIAPIIAARAAAKEKGLPMPDLPQLSLIPGLSPAIHKHAAAAATGEPTTPRRTPEERAARETAPGDFLAWIRAALPWYAVAPGEVRIFPTAISARGESADAAGNPLGPLPFAITGRVEDARTPGRSAAIVAWWAWQPSGESIDGEPIGEWASAFAPVPVWWLTEPAKLRAIAEFFPLAAAAAPRALAAEFRRMLASAQWDALPATRIRMAAELRPRLWARAVKELPPSHAARALGEGKQRSPEMIEATATTSTTAR